MAKRHHDVVPIGVGSILDVGRRGIRIGVGMRVIHANHLPALSRTVSIRCKEVLGVQDIAPR